MFESLGYAPDNLPFLDPTLPFVGREGDVRIVTDITLSHYQWLVIKLSLHIVQTHRWFEQDSCEPVESVQECLEEVGKELQVGEGARLKDIGTTNQRETTVLWDRTTGKCLHNAIGRFIALGTCKNHNLPDLRTTLLNSIKHSQSHSWHGWSPSELLPLTDPPIACPSLNPAKHKCCQYFNYW